MMVARSVIRSTNALHSRALGITVVHSENGSDRIGSKGRRTVRTTLHRFLGGWSGQCFLFHAGHGRLQTVLVLSIALRIRSSLCIEATRATLAGLPVPRRRR